LTRDSEWIKPCFEATAGIVSTECNTGSACNNGSRYHPSKTHQAHSHHSKKHSPKRNRTLRLDKGACYRLLITPADTSMPCDNLFGKSALLLSSCSIACEECFNVAAWHVRSQLIAQVLTGLSSLFRYSERDCSSEGKQGRLRESACDDPPEQPSRLNHHCERTKRRQLRWSRISL
jgi:hypothetical protein